MTYEQPNPDNHQSSPISNLKSQISNRITRLLTLANALLKLEFATQLLCAFVVLFLPPIRLVRPVPRPPAANSRKHPTSAAKAVLHPDKPLAKCLIPLLFVRSGNVRADCVGLTRSDPLPNDTLQLVPF